MPLAGMLLCACAVQTAFGVVDARSSTNTAPPPDGAPWDNVGGVNGASGVYLGGGWALTAAHVGPGNMYLTGTTYPYDGASHRLTNSDGSYTDLYVFHLSPEAGLPNLPALPLASASPAALSLVDFIGFGAIAGSAETNLGPYAGFAWSARGFKSWGNNKARGGVTNLNEGFGNLTCLTTDFTSPQTTGAQAQTSDEAQAAGGDSGGGVFQLTGSGWQLVGMLDSVDLYTNQPANTAVYGNSTFAADIATYRAQILAWIGRDSPPSLSIQRSGARVLLSWTDTAVGYALQTSTNPADTNWTTLIPGLAATNGQGSWLAPAGAGVHFFRLQGP